jgi:hypothetical protein
MSTRMRNFVTYIILVIASLIFAWVLEEIFPTTDTLFVFCIFIGFLINDFLPVPEGHESRRIWPTFSRTWRDKIAFGCSLGALMFFITLALQYRAHLFLAVVLGLCGFATYAFFLFVVTTKDTRDKLLRPLLREGKHDL